LIWFRIGTGGRLLYLHIIYPPPHLIFETKSDKYEIILFHVFIFLSYS
jgi:hypothetical protein